ncbi:hypothetical protein DPMN_047742 [Dreissena polymorpha]|uniref:Uncharacterized protein n=1 Tax=Dreissena polymorpha TaxID=45954 RepID=A0A9D4I1P4_DREPO|nr:hypothetical protein DPMN_047742 [Dreissena polymorpha]
MSQRTTSTWTLGDTSSRHQWTSVRDVYSLTSLLTVSLTRSCMRLSRNSMTLSSLAKDRSPTWVAPAVHFKISPKDYFKTQQHTSKRSARRNRRS